jgi:catecholate siderophore receptor
MSKPACLCLALALAAAAFAAPAAATPDSARLSVPDTTVRHRFDIPAQTLTQSLNTFATMTELTLRLEAQLAPDAQAPALAGEFTLPQALRKLLEGTGLQARFIVNRTVIIARPQTHESPVYNLRPVEVLGVRNLGYSTVRSRTATKTDTPLRDTPQSISVVTRDVIADQSMQSLGDVVRHIPGVSMGLGEGHRDAPTIRGNSSTADFFVDGMRDDAQYYRDLYNTERLEALKGSNAMIFGRGGLGGVINRVTKEPQWVAGRTFTAEGGSFQHRRTTIDLSQPVSGRSTTRLNGLFEDSHSFRSQGELKRYGVNPTALLALGERTSLQGSYEFFRDDRTVDRGIPSFAGKPLATDRGTYFGDADLSYAHARVHCRRAVRAQDGEGNHDSQPRTLHGLRQVLPERVRG